MTDHNNVKNDVISAFSPSVAVTSDGHNCVVRPGEVIVVCSKPGFRRANIEHPAIKIYSRGIGKNKLTEKQLEQMRKEPLLAIIEVS